MNTLNQISKEKMLEKYGEIELSFSNYYKFCFNFIYKNEDLTISGYCGGNDGDIYRYSLNFDTKIKVKDYQDSLNSLKIIKGDELVFEYLD